MVAKSLIAEAVAMFALCFVGGGAILADGLMDDGPGLVGIALAHGLILGVVVTAIMNISGGHVNPAVTFGMLITRRISVVNGILYIIAQLGGGMIAGVLLNAFVFADLTSSTASEPTIATWNGTPHYYAPTLGTDPSISGFASQPAEREAIKWRAARRAVLVEAVLTFLLVFAMFGTVVDPRRPNVGGFGVGLTLTACMLVGGPLTGAGLNPARVLGTGLLFGIGLEEFWQQHWVYWVGPLLGGGAAALLYHFLIMERRPEATPTESE
jgi:aquaporin Z